MKLTPAVLILGSCVLVAAAPPAVRVVRDVAYKTGANDAAHKLDLYLPEGKTGVPVVVSFYGGALSAGDKSDETAVGQRFADAGFVTVVPNYRLSPGVAHPAHVEDAAAAVAWVSGHIKEYGGDPTQLFVIGHSAGAYLAALLVTDGKYLAAHHLSNRDIRGVVPVSAFYWVERTGVAPDRPTYVWGTDRKVWIDASPAHHLRADVPPALVLYADGDEDWRRQQNEEIVPAMKKAGAGQVELVQIARRSHMSIWLNMAKARDEAAERIIAFVRKTAAAKTSF